MSRVDTPVITINAMVRVGPWLVERVDHGRWRKCDRCGTDHKEVWTCTVNAAESEVIAKLGKATWLVGSDCGPQLEKVSDATWDGPTEDARRILRLALDARRTLEKARARGMDHLFLPLVVERLDLLLRGELSRHLQRVLRHHVTRVGESIKALERREQGPDRTEPVSDSTR